MFIHDIIKIEYIRQGYLPDYPYHLISDKEMFDAFLCDEIVVAKDIALNIKQGESSLWEAPQKYIVLFGLSYFELVLDKGSEAILIRGNRYNLSRFKELLGIDVGCQLSLECYFSANYPEPDEFSSEYSDLVSALYYHINAYFESIEAREEATLPDWVYSYMNSAVIGPNSSQEDIQYLLSMLNLSNARNEFTNDVYESCYEISSKWINKLPPNKKVSRPPTMFGELHVVKSLRVAGSLVDASS